MTQAVPTNGFITPPTQQVQPQVQPADAVPGFVVPKTEPAQPAVQPQAPAQATPDLSAALAALTAAMQGATPASTAPAQDEVQADLGSTHESLNDFDVSGIDDPIIRSMATAMQTVGKGLDFDRALGRAVAEGRVDLIDSAYLTERGGVNAKALITIATGIVQAVAAKSDSIAASVHNLAGGQEQWTAGVAVFNTKAPQELRMVVAQMLDSGKENLVQAGAKLIVEFSKNSGALPNVHPLISQGAVGVGAAQALSRDEFMKAHAKLDKYGPNYVAERSELFARRQLGKQLGK